MAELPPPPVPGDANVRAYPWLPIHAIDLREDPLVWRSHPEAFRCAIMLWCAAWIRIPAGSLPNDEVFLARLAGLGRDRRKWRRLRDAALAGWELCADGNLYHPRITKHVLDALRGRLCPAQFNRSTISATTRARVYERDGGICRYCDAPLTLEESTIDHVLAVVRGGTDDISNLALACQPCNASKGRKTLQEWRGR